MGKRSVHPTGGYGATFRGRGRLTGKVSRFFVCPRTKAPCRKDGCKLSRCVDQPATGVRQPGT